MDRAVVESELTIKPPIGYGSGVSASVNRFCLQRSYELPISTPVRNTNAPPSPTCIAADSGGVSM